MDRGIDGLAGGPECEDGNGETREASRREPLQYGCDRTPDIEPPKKGGQFRLKLDHSSEERLGDAEDVPLTSRHNRPGPWRCRGNAVQAPIARGASAIFL